jgi:hypothetical protein
MLALRSYLAMRIPTATTIARRKHRIRWFHPLSSSQEELIRWNISQGREDQRTTPASRRCTWGQR